MSLPRDPYEERAFVARVMNAISTRPRPTPTRAFMTALRDGSINDAASAIAVAWRLATDRRRTVSTRVRARSLALVLGVIFALAAGSLVGAATIQVVADVVTNGPDARQQGVDENGEVENDTPNQPLERVDSSTTTEEPEEPEGSEGQSDAKEPGGEDGPSVTDESAPNEAQVDAEVPANDGQSGTDESSGEEAQVDAVPVDGQVNANEPDGANNQSGTGDAGDQALTNQQGSNDAPPVTDQPATDPAQGGTNEPNGNNGGGSNAQPGAQPAGEAGVESQGSQTDL